MAKEIDYSIFSNQQLAYARLKADPDCVMTNAEMAKAVGVSERTIYRWNEDADIIALINDLAEKQMDLFLSTLYKQLQKRILKGSDKALELGLKRAGKLKEVREVSGQVDVEVQHIEGKSNSQLLEEIKRLEERTIGSANKLADKIIDAEYTVVDPEPKDDNE